MSSARELLEQADALMQRNRRPPSGDDIPELTDAVSDDALPRAALTEAAVPSPAAQVPASVDDIPELTEAVEEIEATSIQEYPDDPDELSRWLQHDGPKIPAGVREAASVEALRDAPRAFVASPSQSPASLPEAMLRADAFARPERDVSVEAYEPAAPVASSWPLPVDAPVSEVSEEIFLDDVPEPDATEAAREPDGLAASERVSLDAPQPAATEATREPDGLSASEHVSLAVPEAPAQATPPSGADDPERWNALAEEIRMQVLQRIDIFTDTGLREQLTARLQPVVDRASADLVATINREVGQLLRTYVAEAIEREIDHWRRGGG